MPYPNEIIHVHKGGYEEAVIVKMLPSMGRMKFRRLLRTLLNSENVNSGEWRRLGQLLTLGIEEAEARLAITEKHVSERCVVISRFETGYFELYHNKSLESMLRSDECIVHDWKTLKAIYDSECVKHKR